MWYVLHCTICWVDQSDRGEKRVDYLFKAHWARFRLNRKKLISDIVHSTQQSVVMVTQQCPQWVEILSEDKLLLSRKWRGVIYITHFRLQSLCDMDNGAFKNLWICMSCSECSTKNQFISQFIKTMAKLCLLFWFIRQFDRLKNWIYLFVGI